MVEDGMSFALPHDRCQVMGILNVTPDSFSDGGRYVQPRQAIAQGLRLIDEGADILDIGGESTRPGAASVPVQEEMDRVLPVIEALARETDTPLSVDTSNPEVMRAAVAVGARLINDVRALRMPGALEAAAATGVPVCLMHMRGEPRTMQASPCYGPDVVGEVMVFLAERIAACEAVGIDRTRLWIDPGFGFGKDLTHNLALLAQLDRLRLLQCPVVVGLSRKSMLGQMLGGNAVSERLPASLAGALWAAARGAAVVRVHDVRATVDALRIWHVLASERAARADA
ncbi:MAG TPA: dihydropteroate synthase [Candidatus Macondimonas sp.]|nr:dihydropteroate synthase [Candidatus Macondimonas sp.]